MDTNDEKSQLDAIFAYPSPTADVDKLEAELRGLTCQDNSCTVVKHTGAGTNGGCRCVDWSMLPPDMRVRLRRMLAIRREQVEGMHAELERLERVRRHHVASEERLAEELEAALTEFTQYRNEREPHYRNRAEQAETALSAALAVMEAAKSAIGICATEAVRDDDRRCFDVDPTDPGPCSWCILDAALAKAEE